MDEMRAAPPTAMDRLATLALAVAATCLVGLVVVQGWQVFARYVLNNSPSWTEPVTLVLLSTAMSLSAAAGVRNRRHFAFSLLAQALSPRIERALQAFTSLLVATIGAVLAVWGWRLWVDGMSIPMAGARLPQSSVYLPLAVGGALMVVFALAQLRAPRATKEGG